MPETAFKLKTTPSDFIVEEITSDKKILALDKAYSFDGKPRGKFLHFILQKENRDTFEALDEIARKLNVSRDVFSIAGMKDKRAVTSQLASAYKIKKEQLDKVKVRGAKLIPLRYSSKKIFLGNLWGNRFMIVVRGISGAPREVREFIENRMLGMQRFFPNYFGRQRFGEDKSTSEIGKLILARDFKDAAKLCAKKYRECACYLEEHPKDYVGTVKQLPPKLQRMFIHAVQSEIFNRALDEIISRKITDGNLEIPLPGYLFSSRIFTSETDKIVEKILADEKIQPQKFRISEILGISSAGEKRKAFESFYDFKILSVEKDGLNRGKTKAVLQFSLPKAAYATVFVEHLFKHLFLRLSGMSCANALPVSFSDPLCFPPHPQFTSLRRRQIFLKQHSSQLL